MSVNNRAYSWEHTKVIFPDFEMEVQSIDYDDALEKEVIYGTGNIPRGYGTGNYKANAKITVLKDDWNDFIDYCKKKNLSIYKIIIEKIVCSYADENERTRTDVINKIAITKVADKMKQGDKSFVVDIELCVFGTIERDGVKAI